MVSTPKDKKNLQAIEALIDKNIPRIDNPISNNKTKKFKRSQPTKLENISLKNNPDSIRSRKSSALEQKGSEKTAIIGMGEHLPNFIALSFQQRLANS